MNQQSPTEMQTPTTIEIVTDFARGAEGWSAGFCDFGLGDVDLGLAAGIRELPENLGLPGTGYFLTGMNRHDDLFMFLTARLTGQDGIRTDGMYDLEFEIQLASDAPSGSAGAGGAPGESVLLKAGGGPVQPTPIISPGGSEGGVRINIDKGHQSHGGPFAGVVGNIANGLRPDQPRSTFC